MDSEYYDLDFIEETHARGVNSPEPAATLTTTAASQTGPNDGLTVGPDCDAACQAPDDLASGGEMCERGHDPVSLVQLLRRWSPAIERACEANLAPVALVAAASVVEFAPSDGGAASQMRWVGARHLDALASCPLRPFDGVALFGPRPDGDDEGRVAAAGLDAATLAVFFAARGSRSCYGCCAGTATAAAFTPDGGALFVGTREGVLHAFDRQHPSWAAATVVTCGEQVDGAGSSLLVPAFSDFSGLFGGAPDTASCASSAPICAIATAGAGGEASRCARGSTRAGAEWFGAPRELLAGAGLRTLIGHPPEGPEGGAGGSSDGAAAGRVFALDERGGVAVWVVDRLGAAAAVMATRGVALSASTDTASAAAAAADLCMAVGSRLRLVRVVTLDVSGVTALMPPRGVRSAAGDGRAAEASVWGAAFAAAAAPSAMALRGCAAADVLGSDVFVGTRAGVVLRRSGAGAQAATRKYGASAANRAVASISCRSAPDDGETTTSAVVFVVGYDDASLALYDARHAAPLHVWRSPWGGGTSPRPLPLRASRLVAAFWLPGKAAAFAAVDDDSWLAVWDLSVAAAGGGGAAGGRAMEPVVLRRLVPPAATPGAAPPRNSTDPGGAATSARLRFASISGGSGLLVGTSVVTLGWSSGQLSWVVLRGPLAQHDGAAVWAIAGARLRGLGGEVAL